MPQIILKIDDKNDKVFEDEKIACYIINSEIEKNKIIEAVNTNKMVLAYGKDADICCMKYNLDGIVATFDKAKPIKAQLKPLREKLKGKTLGIITPPCRHEIMLCGEVEPDFMVISVDNVEKNKEIVDWYNELFLLPLALDFGNNFANAKTFNADFVIINAQNFENYSC